MVILIPELGEIGKPELLNLFSELRIFSILEVLELFQSKAELLVLFGLNIVLFFIEIIPELLKLKEF